MERKEFLLKFGLGTIVVCSGCLWGCGTNSNPTSPQAPQNVDFTLDLNAQENSPLLNPGGSLYKNGILIGRVSAASYIAVSQACTHQGTTVQFQLSSNRIHCPNHGSNFSFDGSVINGPASSPLQKYNTTLTGTNLRVFS